MDFPETQITRAVQSGRATLATANLPLEPEGVGFAVERHRWAWKPETVRVLLIAESHVFTSEEHFRLRIAPHRLPPEARHAPPEYVRLIYCLGYGESHLLSPVPSEGNSG